MTTGAIVNLFIFTLCLTVSGIFLCLFYPRKHSSLSHKATSSNAPSPANDDETEYELSQPIVPSLADFDDTAPAEHTSLDDTEHNRASLLLEEDLVDPLLFTKTEIFSRLTHSLGLHMHNLDTPSTRNPKIAEWHSSQPNPTFRAWLPSDVLPRLALTQHSAAPQYDLMVLNSATPVDHDFYLFLCLHKRPSTPQPQLVILIRSYRLNISPDVVTINSHALQATAEGLHDTLLLYRTASSASLETHQTFLLDALSIFETLAAPPNPQLRTAWKKIVTKNGEI